MQKMKGNALGINIDHIATIREARQTSYPSITEAAELAISGGADQITIHLREDRRHIQDKDVFNLKKELSVPLNLEMAAEDEIVGIAIEVKPRTSTLVPEKREELTTEGGLDCVANEAKLARVIEKLKRAQIEVSLFIDPNFEQVKMAHKLGAEAVELHTGSYCNCEGPQQTKELKILQESAKLAKELGFRVCAGHGLNYSNTGLIARSVPEFVEYNIGHAIVARAVFVGLYKAVQEMKDIIN